MSAFIVSKAHIDALVSRGERQVTDAASAYVGRMLWLENYVSVASRYPYTPDDLPGPCDFTFSDIDDYVYEPPARKLTTVELLKAIHCYRYNSCEHDGWQVSEAKAWCELLTAELIGRLPGYDEAAWEID